MNLIHYTITTADYEYGGKFVSIADDLETIISEIICLDDDEDVTAIARTFRETGRYEFDCGERALTDIRIRPVPEEDANVLSKYL